MDVKTGLNDHKEETSKSKQDEVSMRMNKSPKEQPALKDSINGA